MNNFGQNIRKFREKNGWSQEKFANKLVARMQKFDKKFNYTNRSISMWEKGDRLPSLEILVILSEMMSVTVDELLKSEIESLRSTFNSSEPRRHILSSISSIHLSNEEKTYYKSEDGEFLPVDDKMYMVLYDSLKAWRLAKSAELNLPPYCIFTNDTLSNIVDLLPSSENLLWLVSGLSGAKIQQYSPEIISTVNDFKKEHRIKEVFYGRSAVNPTGERIASCLGSMGLLDYFAKPPKPGEAGEDKKSAPLFSIESFEKFVITDTPATITDISDKNTSLKNQSIRRIFRQAVTEWLMAEGYLTEYFSKGGKRSIVATEKGESIGLITDLKRNNAGYIYYVVLYDAEAQRFILDNKDGIVGLYEKNEAAADSAAAEAKKNDKV